MILATSEDALGAVQPIIDAWRSRGEVVNVGLGYIRGDAASVHLRTRIDRDVVESEFDLGPLVSWLPAPGFGMPEGWVLHDTYSGTRVYGAGPQARAAAGPSTPPARRIRVGYVDQHPDLRMWPWELPTPEVELGRVGLAHEHPEASWRFVECADVEETVARAHEVLGAVLRPLAAGVPPEELVGRLPVWFREGCARPYQPGEPPTSDASPFERTYQLAPVGMVDMGADRLRDWSIRWTAENWLVAMQPSQRLWEWRASVPVSSTIFQLGFSGAGYAVPRDAATWLLQVCGGSLVTGPFLVDDHGHRLPDPPPPPPVDPPPPLREPMWKRIRRHFAAG